MGVRGKKYLEALKKVDRTRRYSVEEAISLALETSYADFDETVELAVRLGVDPKRSDQQVRGSVVLPHGIGKKIKVLVFAKGEKEKEAIEAGADIVGAEDLIAKIQQGWMEFDRAVATPDMMSSVGKLGKILGPRGLMPNPKTGTVTFDVAKAVRELKQGKVEFKVDKAGNVHVPIGKVSFGFEKLYANFKTIMEAIIRAKPVASKGTYLRSVTISTTMGPGIKIDPAQVQNMIK